MMVVGWVGAWLGVWVCGWMGGWLGGVDGKGGGSKALYGILAAIKNFYIL
jgi:hypothetical protein